VAKKTKIVVEVRFASMEEPIPQKTMASTMEEVSHTQLEIKVEAQVENK